MDHQPSDVNVDVTEQNHQSSDVNVDVTEKNTSGQTQKSTRLKKMGA